MMSDLMSHTCYNYRSSGELTEPAHTVEKSYLLSFYLSQAALNQYQKAGYIAFKKVALVA
jgi:hypothetical protein